MQKYDLIIVLGSQPDPKTWLFPKQIYDCLDKAKILLDTKQAPYILTSGKVGISLEHQGVTQPFRECDAMADYLTDRGVSKDKILVEGESKDTISNLYFIKTRFLIPRRMTSLVFVVAEFRTPRLRFLCDKVLGRDYKVHVEPIKSDAGSTYNEPKTFEKQKNFLLPMDDGNHKWLEDKFYSSPIYQND